MIPIVVFLAGASVLLLWTIAEEVLRERAFRRRNRVRTATQETSTYGVQVPARERLMTNRRPAGRTTREPFSHARRSAERGLESR